MLGLLTTLSLISMFTCMASWAFLSEFPMIMYISGAMWMVFGSAFVIDLLYLAYCRDE